MHWPHQQENFVLIVNFSLCFRNLCFVPGSIFSNLKKAYFRNWKTKNINWDTSCAKSFIFSLKLSFAPSGGFPALNFFSCCSINILERGSLQGKTWMKSCCRDINVNFILVNFLSPNDWGCVPGAAGVEVHLAQPHGGWVQQGLRLVNESLRQ